MRNQLAIFVLGVVVAAGCSSQGSRQPGEQAAEQAAPSATSAPGEPGGAARDTTATAAQAAPTPAPEPPKPQFREVTLPAGTELSATLETSVSSDQSRAEDTVRARLVRAVERDGLTVVPEGASLSGVVLEAHESGRVKGRASVAFRFTRLIARNESHTIATRRIVRQADATKGDDAKKVGVGAGAGAVIGAIAGGGKGAAIGGAIGAGAGTGAVLATRGKEVRLGPGARVRVVLDEPVAILVPVS
jgi:hypothetical protein